MKKRKRICSCLKAKSLQVMLSSIRIYYISTDRLWRERCGSSWNGGHRWVCGIHNAASDARPPLWKLFCFVFQRIFVYCWCCVPDTLLCSSREDLNPPGHPEPPFYTTQRYSRKLFLKPKYCHCHPGKINISGVVLQCVTWAGHDLWWLGSLLYMISLTASFSQSSVTWLHSLVLPAMRIDAIRQYDSSIPQ